MNIKNITYDITRKQDNVIIVVKNKNTNDSKSMEYNLIFPDYILGYHYIDDENIQNIIDEMIKELVIRGI